MARRSKMIIATLATVLVATLGAAGVSTSSSAVGTVTTNANDRSWCC